RWRCPAVLPRLHGAQHARQRRVLVAYRGGRPVLAFFLAFVQHRRVGALATGFASSTFLCTVAHPALSSVAMGLRLALSPIPPSAPQPGVQPDVPGKRFVLCEPLWRPAG